jgi:hypothetical protein
LAQQAAANTKFERFKLEVDWIKALPSGDGVNRQQNCRTVCLTVLVVCWQLCQNCGKAAEPAGKDTCCSENAASFTATGSFCQASILTGVDVQPPQLRAFIQVMNTLSSCSDVYAYFYAELCLLCCRCGAGVHSGVLQWSSAAGA